MEACQQLNQHILMQKGISQPFGGAQASKTQSSIRYFDFWY
jgi:hypothetical protein